MLFIHSKENMRTQEVAIRGRSKATINSLLIFPVTKCHLKDQYIFVAKSFSLIFYVVTISICNGCQYVTQGLTGGGQWCHAPWPPAIAAGDVRRSRVIRKRWKETEEESSSVRVLFHICNSSRVWLTAAYKLSPAHGPHVIETNYIM